MEELNTCKCTRDQEEGAPYLGEAEKGGGGEEVWNGQQEGLLEAFAKQKGIKIWVSMEL